ncbi:hypothetical protein GOBAR_AA19201 [Gossypium barbadense]|uniref:Uncharacterized protein n=1 Tax=Gossypium barbadense TaxID=3634 RepID=A0A2P5XDT8_GOSBA|nr:hypothetical protein GOBAR_AA19201 [Gossypium barbadense]
MLSKFISVSETRFQNTEIVLKNQQVSIQSLETQIGQLSKLISERPQGSLPSNTEPNPKEQLNAINIQDDKGVVEPKLELRKEIVVNSHSGGETKQSPFKLAILATHQELKKMSLKEAHELFSSTSRGPVLKIEDYKLRNSMNSRRTNQEHLTN